MWMTSGKNNPGSFQGGKYAPGCAHKWLQQGFWSIHLSVESELPSTPGVLSDESSPRPVQTKFLCLSRGRSRWQGKWLPAGALRCPENEGQIQDRSSKRTLSCEGGPGTWTQPLRGGGENKATQVLFNCQGSGFYCPWQSPRALALASRR